MNPENKIYRIHPDIVFREEDDGAFLFNPKTNALRSVNKVGAYVCRYCDGKSDVDAICHAARNLSESAGA